jgi:hypothetical protein
VKNSAALFFLARRANIFSKTSATALRRTKQGKLNLEDCNMLWTIFVILLVLWLLGLVSSYTLGGFIHILLVLAIIVLIINLVSGRRGV